MAKAKKPTKKDNPLKVVPGGNGATSESEPLESFQETEKTGRKKKDKPNIEAPKVAHEEITKVKMDKKGFLEITYSVINSDGSSVDRPERWKNRTAHPDLKAKMDLLRPHLALLCNHLSKQLLKDINSYNEEQIADFTVRGISIGLNHEWYIITGLCKNFAGQFFNLNTPKQNVDTSEETRYRYMDDLEEAVHEILEEVKLYAAGTKVGEAQQTQLDFDEEEEPEEGAVEDTYSEEAR